MCLLNVLWRDSCLKKGHDLCVLEFEWIGDGAEEWDGRKCLVASSVIEHE